MDKEPDPFYKSRLKNILREIGKSKDLPERARAYEMWTNPKKLSGNLLHDALYEEILTKVKLEADPKYEADYLRNRAYFIEQQKAKGGLFEEGPNSFIAKANRFAKGQGYANYAELRVQEKYKVSVADYKKMAIAILARNKPKIEQTIKEMRPFMDPSRPAWELNMYYLHEEKRARAMKVLGLKEEPTLLDKEAVEVVKAFYKNMGFDVDHPPLDGKVILDLWAREKKTPSGAYQVPIQFGQTNVLMTTYKPDKGISLDDLAWQLTHELGHAVHFIYATKNANGSPFGGAEPSNSVALREGIGMIFQRVSKTKEFMDRYLARYPQFSNPKVREALATGYAEYDTFWQSVCVARALWEINLYEQETASMENRLNYWGELGLKYLGYDDIGLATSKVTFYNTSYMHPALDPLQYIAYNIGDDFIGQVSGDLQRAIGSGEQDKIHAAFDRFAKLLEKGGALYTVQDAEKSY